MRAMGSAILSPMKNTMVLILFAFLLQRTAMADVSFYMIEPFRSGSIHELVHENGQSDIARVVLAKNEFEPIRLVLETKKDVGEVTLAVSEFVNEDGHILNSHHVDVRVVKNWKQLLPFSYAKSETPNYHNVDELLLKDDLTALAGHWRKNRYIPPNNVDRF